MVCREVDYAQYDDGDLSIVIANVSTNIHISAELEKLFDNKDRTRYHKNIFVMRGHHRELDTASVSRYAMTHTSVEDNKFENYVAKRFSHDMLLKLHSFVQRFKEEIRLGKLCDDDGFDPKFDQKDGETVLSGIDSTINYMDYRDQTTKLLILEIENE